MLDRNCKPEIGEFGRFEIAKPQIFQLKNGIKETLFFNEQLELIHFVVVLNTGILHETKKHLATLCMALLKGAAKGYSQEEVDDFLDYYGVSWDTEMGMLTTKIIISIPLRNCTQVLPFVLNMLLNPVFEEDALDRQKKIHIKRLEYNLQKESYCVTQLMFKTIFGENSFRGTLLTREHIEAVTCAELDAYYRQLMVASNVSVYVAGRVGEVLQKQIEDVFSQIPQGMVLLKAERMLETELDHLVYESRAGSMQSSFTLCRRLVPYTHPDRRALSVLFVLFGGYFGSRLMQNLRETNGYTYGVFNGTMYFGDQSVYYIDSDVNVDKTKVAINACYEEMHRICDNEIGTEEITIVRNYMMGNLLRDLDGPIKLMKKYIYWQSFGYDEQEYYQMIDTIGTMDGEQLRALAQTYLQPSEFTSIVVGKY